MRTEGASTMTAPLRRWGSSLITLVTIRAWIRDGQVRAYLFQGREYRTPEAALEELQQKERGKGEQ